MAAAAAPEWLPEVDARVSRVGAWILVIADLFFFAAFLFAFFYLRSANNDSSWQVHGVAPPSQAIGALIVALMIVTAGVYYFAVRGAGIGRPLLWLAFAIGVVAVGAQVYEFRHLGFDPQQGGGYPSVFVGLKGALMVQFAIALLWLLTHVAQARPLGDWVARRATALSFSNFLFFLAGIGVIAYIVLYFV